MKTKLMLFLIASLFTFGVLTSCADMSLLIPSAPMKGQATPQVKQAQPTQTLGATPIPTQDWQAAYNVAATNERAAQMALEAVNIEIARITQQAAQNELDTITQKNIADGIALADKQLTIYATQTAFPAMATEASDRREDQLRLITEQNKADAARPTQMIANKNAELYVKNADRNATIDAGLRIAAIAVACMFAMYLFVASISIAVRASRPAPVEAVRDLNAEEKGFEPIPMVTSKENPNQTLRAEIHCTNEQLFTIANGIINENKTLAFGQWEGTEISKAVLTIVRHALDRHKIIKALKDGDYDVATNECETFMRYTLEHGYPPPPFKCVG